MGAQVWERGLRWGEPSSMNQGATWDSIGAHPGYKGVPHMCDESKCGTQGRQRLNSRSRATNWLDLFSSLQSESAATWIDPNATCGACEEMGGRRSTDTDTRNCHRASPSCLGSTHYVLLRFHHSFRPVSLSPVMQRP